MTRYSTLVLEAVDRFGQYAFALWLIVTGYGALGLWQGDMAGIFMAARFVADGHPELIYAANAGLVSETPDAWLPALTALGKADVSTFPYVYPPLWAMIFAPLAGHIQIQTLLNGALILQLCLYFWSVRLAWLLVGQFMPWGRWALIALPISAFAGAPVIALLLNQPQITISFLILLATYQLVLAREIRAGLVLALAASIKLTPLIFILLFPALRRWRGLAAMIGGLALMAGLGVILAGPDLTLAFAARAKDLSEQTILSRIAYNIGPILLQLLPGDVTILKAFPDASFVALTPPVLKALSGAVLLALLALALWLTRHHDPQARAFELATALTLIAALAGPIGWIHYYLGPTLLLPGLLRAGNPVGVWAFVLCAAIVLSFAFMLNAPIHLAFILPTVVYAACLMLVLTGFMTPSSRIPRRAPLRPAAP